MSKGIRVTVWNEGLHEKEVQEIAAIYPNGMGGRIGASLQGRAGIESVHLSELSHEGQGLTDEILNDTDVLVWWGHKAHAEVTDENAGKVQKRVLENGMGLIALHSAHMSKPFMRLMGTGCMLRWRSIGERERLWVVNPAHPITEGLPECFELEHHEMYGEHFDIPQPDDLVFISWFQGGEVFRSGCCWNRGLGKVFYFSPGHEEYPIYHNENVLRVIYNAVKWAAMTGLKQSSRGHFPDPIEKI